QPELCSACVRKVCLSRLSFFFQAEDGIRDSSVTGVQTCALPIFAVNLEADDRAAAAGHPGKGDQRYAYQIGAGIGQLKAKHDWRSEERRVGKECRSRW